MTATKANNERSMRIIDAVRCAMNEDLPWPTLTKSHLRSSGVFDPCSSGNLPISPAFLLEGRILKLGEEE